MEGDKKERLPLFLLWGKLTIFGQSKQMPVSVFCSVTVTEDGMKALVTLANGDMRRALNILQVFFYYYFFISLLIFVWLLIFCSPSIQTEFRGFFFFFFTIVFVPTLLQYNKNFLQACEPPQKFEKWCPWNNTTLLYRKSALFFQDWVDSGFL